VLSRHRSAAAVESLVEKSLVRVRVRHTRADGEKDGGGQDARFRLLETIREYALEQLDVHGERALVRRRRAEYYLRSAEIVVGQISSAHQAAWLHSLELEHDNLRAALAWCQDAGEPELGLRAAGLLAWFCQVRGHMTEGRARLAELLTLAGSPPELRSESLRFAATLELEPFSPTRCSTWAPFTSRSPSERGTWRSPRPASARRWLCRD
jgi:predicted ATPase